MHEDFVTSKKVDESEKSRFSIDVICKRLPFDMTTGTKL